MRGSLRISWLPEQLVLYDAISNGFANVYNRFFKDDANYGVIYLKEERKEIEDRHSWGFYGCVRSFNPSSNNDLAATPKK